MKSKKYKLKKALLKNNKLVYSVNPLPYSLLNFVYDFASLEEKDERKYIQKVSFKEEPIEKENIYKLKDEEKPKKKEEEKPKEEKKKKRKKNKKSHK